MSSLFVAAAAAESKAKRQAESGALADRNAHRRDLSAWDTTLFDIAACHRREICIGLYDVEANGVTHNHDTWPDVVQKAVADEIERFKAEHPEASIRCTTYGLVKYRNATQCCVVVHYTAKARS